MFRFTFKSNCYLTFLGFSLFMQSSCLKKQTTSDVQTVSGPKDVLWNKTTLEVCWENKSPETKSFREEVQKFVTTEIHKTRMRTSGWTTCPPSGGDVRILIFDDPVTRDRKPTDKDWDLDLYQIATSINFDPGYQQFAGQPRARELGRKAQGMSPSLVINQTFKLVAPVIDTIVSKLTESGKQNFALFAALHEFGHILGMLHEDAHPDKTCKQFAENYKTAVNVTPYNYGSFMSRCFYRNYDFNKGKVGLNQKDVEGINKMYEHLFK